jgi:hypothetical protein
VSLTRNLSCPPFAQRVYPFEPNQDFFGRESDEHARGIPAHTALKMIHEM